MELETTSEADLRGIDYLVGKHIVNLPKIGWYRRKSCYNREYEECGRKDTTPDHPMWKASLDYWQKGYSHPFSVPCYSTDVSKAMEALRRIPAEEVSVTWKRQQGGWLVQIAVWGETHAGFVKGEWDDQPAIAMAFCKAMLAWADKQGSWTQG